jgi:hypothetical protein
MSSILHVFIDVSGSMQELGKRFIATNVISYVRNVPIIQPEQFDKFIIRLYVCNDTVTEIPVLPNQDFTLLSPSGKFNAEVLFRFLNEIKPQSVLFLSDKPLDKNDLTKLEAIELQNCRFAFVAIGVDAKLPLKKDGKNWKAFNAQDISAALDFVMNNVRSLDKLPNSINGLNFTNTANKADD